MNSKRFSLLLRRGVVLTLACFCFFVVLVVLDEMEDTIDIEQSNQTAALPMVTVSEVSVQQENARVEAFSEVQPKWQLDLKTEVGGTVNVIHANAMQGMRVEKGQILIELDNTRYLAELADAKHLLQQSLLGLQRAQYDSRVAKHQFTSVGEQPPNDLALYLPQIDIAKAAVSAAKARIALAQRQLALTEIKAPFTGFVVTRHISLGQIVMAGEPVVRLVSEGDYELAVSLSKKQWQQLAHPIAGQTVALFDDQGLEVGVATVRDAGGYLDAGTRHYQVQLSTNKQLANILAGDYLQAVFTGRALVDALRIPATALTVDGSVWWVDEQQLLQRSQVEIFSRDDDQLVVNAPKPDVSVMQVVEIPLSSYLPGQKVEPQVNSAGVSAEALKVDARTSIKDKKGAE